MMAVFSGAQVQRFVEEGYLRLEAAFPRELADEGRELLWRDTGCDPHDPSTWTRPVIRLFDYPQEPFRRAVNTPRLRAAFDELVGPGRWVPRGSLGTFPVRFPHADEPGDSGWHADASFAGEDGSWRINVSSRGRALLMLFLFSDVGPDDAPTRIRVGSHLDVPLVLEPAGEDGMDVFAMPWDGIGAERRVEHATGLAGDVYLCHPFIVHAAQPHRGTVPRFMAQPPLVPSTRLELQRGDGAYSPVESAVRLGLGLRGDGRGNADRHTGTPPQERFR